VKGGVKRGWKRKKREKNIRDDMRQNDQRRDGETQRAKITGY
jgi:hypothetical protein